MRLTNFVSAVSAGPLLHVPDSLCTDALTVSTRSTKRELSIFTRPVIERSPVNGESAGLVPYFRGDEPTPTGIENTRFPLASSKFNNSVNALISKSRPRTDEPAAHMPNQSAKEPFVAPVSADDIDGPRSPSEVEINTDSVSSPPPNVLCAREIGDFEVTANDTFESTMNLPVASPDFGPSTSAGIGMPLTQPEAPEIDWLLSSQVNGNDDATRICTADL